MKILEVSPRYFPHIGGVEEHVRNVSERLARNHEVAVCTTDPSGKLPKEEIIKCVKIKRFKSWAPSEAYYFSGDLKKYLVDNAGSFDIVHAHSYHAFPAVYAAQAKKENKLVFTPHYTGGGQTFFRNLLHIPYRFLVTKVFQRTDKIICVSKYEKSVLSRRFKRDSEDFVYIPNGINLEEFKCLKKEKKNYKLVLCVARLEKYKGVQFLLRALSRLSSDTRLEVVGKGPYKSSLVKLSRSLNLENRVRFSQDLQRRELLQKYAEADVFVLVSEYEAMPISLAEALASQTPCVVSDIPFLKEWIDNKTCFGIDYPVNVNELASLIDKVSNTQFGSVKLWDWNDVVEEIEGVYVSLKEEDSHVIGG